MTGATKISFLMGTLNNMDVTMASDSRKLVPFLQTLGVDSLMWLIVSGSAACAAGSVLQCLGLGKRVMRQCLIPKLPSNLQLRKWIESKDAQAQASASSTSPGQHALVHVPAKMLAEMTQVMVKKKERLNALGRWQDVMWDPIKLLKAVIFARHLKSPKYFLMHP